MGANSDTEGNSLIETERRGRALLVRVQSAEVTMFALPELRLAVDELLAEKPERLVLDFSRSSFLDSSALGWIFKLQHTVESYGGRFALSGLRSSLRRVLGAVVKRDEIRFFDSAEDALQDA